jgi:type I restriction enzyme S subunit
VFTQRGTLGQVSIVPAEPFDRYLISQSQMKLTVDRDKADPLFFYYVFHTPEQQEYMRQRAIQTGVPHTNLGILRDTPVPVPPPDQQRAIAHILGTLDDKIELNRRMNETLEAIARALFKSWFVDFDPVRAKAEGRNPGLPKHIADLFPDSFEDSELGEIPKGWDVDEIKARASRIQYGLTQSASETPIGPRFLRITDIQGGRIDWRRVPYCAVSEEEDKKYRVIPGDILVARTGASTGENVYITQAPDAVFASYLVRFQFAHSSMARIVGEYMRTNSYFEHVAGAIGGSAQPNASAQVLAGATLVFPPLSIAEQFANLVEPMDQLRAENETQSAILATIREALLPKLISGEIRVGNANVAMEIT